MCIRVWMSCASAALLATVAVADVKVYLVDGAGITSAQACHFDAGYAGWLEAACVFDVPAGDGAIYLLEAQATLCDALGLGQAAPRPARVSVFAATAAGPQSLIASSPIQSGTPTGVNVFQLAPLSIVLAAPQQFAVSIELLQQSSGGALHTSFATDSDGCTTAKAWFRDGPGAWVNPCTAGGYAGDPVVRVKVLTEGPVGYGTGTIGTLLSPLLGSSGPWMIGSTQFAAHVSTFKAFAPGAVALSTASAALPLFGGTLWIDPANMLLFPIVCNAIGQAEKALPIPYSAALIGQHVYLQAGLVDAGGPQGFALSRGLDVKISSN